MKIELFQIEIHEARLEIVIGFVTADYGCQFLILKTVLNCVVSDREPPPSTTSLPHFNPHQYQKHHVMLIQENIPLFIMWVLHRFHSPLQSPMAQTPPSCPCSAQVLIQDASPSRYLCLHHR